VLLADLLPMTRAAISLSDFQEAALPETGPPESEQDRQSKPRRMAWRAVHLVLSLGILVMTMAAVGGIWSTAIAGAAAQRAAHTRRPAADNSTALKESRATKWT